MVRIPDMHMMSAERFMFVIQMDYLCQPMRLIIESDGFDGSPFSDKGIDLICRIGEDRNRRCFRR